MIMSWPRVRMPSLQVQWLAYNGSPNQLTLVINLLQVSKVTTHVVSMKDCTLLLHDRKLTRQSSESRLT